MYTPKPEDRQRVDRNFTYHPPITSPLARQTERYQQIRDSLRREALRLLELCPPSTERDKAITHLESAGMWANAAIARHETLEGLIAMHNPPAAEPAAELQTITAADVGEVAAEVTKPDA
jgi:magnesium-transporting ATPase (P-type)